MPRRGIITIDGPAGSGKSTVGRLLAQRLGYLYMDTGAMYRALAWKALQLGIALEDSEALTRLAEASRIMLSGDPEHVRVTIDGHDVTEAIRSPEISRAASVIATIEGVRRAIVAAQREMGREGGVVLEGRDTGTVVFPDADVKFFLDARPEVRAQRRLEQERAQGRAVSFEETLQETLERDRRDQERSASPLRRAEDAIYLDSSDVSVEQVVEHMLEIIQQRLPEGTSSRSAQS
ncbi:MAG: (d)CMP kinase [Blastocatellia bacterium]|nr:(d)CMP kinase [Blastocatellia bacterium]MCX7751771.1 (d)CMP kinase [Blastocatellia bacterium]